MPDTTAHWEIPKPEPGDPPDGPAQVSALADHLDGNPEGRVPMVSQGVLGDRPISTPGQPGKQDRRYLVVGDPNADNNGIEWVDTGTSWIALASAVPALSITNGELADDSVNSRVIAPNAVGGSELADGSVDAAAIIDGVVGSAELANALKPSAGAGAAAEALRAIGVNPGEVLGGNDLKLDPTRVGTAPAVRILGTGATDAMAGNDERALGAWSALGLSKQDGVESGGVISRQSAVLVRVTAGSGWVTGGDGIRRFCTWAQTDIAVAGTGNANERVDTFSVPAPSFHGQVVVPERVGGSEQAAIQALDDVSAGTSRAALGNRIRLGEVIVANAGVVANGAGLQDQVRDRRQWANGFRYLFDYGAGNLTPGASNAAYTALHATLLKFRVESSGAPGEFIVRGNLNMNAAHTGVWLAPIIDGAASQLNEAMISPPVTTTGDVPINPKIPLMLAAGSHTLNLAYKIGGTAVPTFRALIGSGEKLTIGYREIIGQNANNGAA